MTCATCRRVWVPLAGEEPATLCPTCRWNMLPLSVKRAGKEAGKGEKRKPAEEQA